MKQFFKSRPITLKALPILLALIAFLSYGLVIRKLGIYWDDWAYLWTKMELGYAGVVRHFSFSRPLAGQIQNLVMQLTGMNPLVIQLYGLLMRVICSALVGLLVYRLSLKKVFPGLAAGLLFMTYPGFTMQPIALNFGFSYLLISLLTLSFLISLRKAETPRWHWGWTLLGLLLAAVNLFASEYFFMLELLRPILIWGTCTQLGLTGKERWQRLVRVELPYALMLGLGVIYRLFFNQTQTLHYEFSLVEQFKADPFAALVGYLNSVWSDSVKALAGAWLWAFRLPDRQLTGARTFQVYLIVSCLTFLIMLTVFLLIRNESGKKERRAALFLILTGMIATLLAGQPFWLTGSYLSFVFPNSRYTLPFMLGMAFFWAGIFSLISSCRKPGVVLSTLAIACMVGMSTGSHFITANEYRRDWTLTKDFFQQLKWRVPALAENTAVITNSLPIRFSTDNSLTAPLNWIYAEAYEAERIPYILYTNTKREETLSKFEPGKEISQEYLSARFEGSTDHSISLYYQAPGCVHVLDPEVDLFNQTIPNIDRDAALLNNYDRILADAPYEPLDPVLFGEELPKNWCWYYEHADLARQQGDWDQIALLAEEAFQLNDHPNDPMERIPFIEGFAHTLNWQQALDQTTIALETTPLMNNPLCAVWNRIQKDTQDSAEKQDTILNVERLLDCSFLR